MKDSKGRYTLLAINIYNLRDFVLGLLAIALTPVLMVVWIIGGLVRLGRDMRWEWRR